MRRSIVLVMAVFVLFALTTVVAATQPAQPQLLDDNEPNDICQDATPLDPGQAISGTIDPVADVDWYQVPVEPNTPLTVTLTLNHSQAEQFDFSAFTLCGLVGDADHTGPVKVSPGQAVVTFSVESLSGFIYIAVGDDDDRFASTEPYTLLVQVDLTEEEPNDTCQDATAIPTQKDVVGALDAVGDGDIYKVVVEPNIPLLVTLTLHHPDAETAFEPFAFTLCPPGDADHTFGDPVAGYDELVVTFALESPTGLVYLAIVAQDGFSSEQPYRLQVEVGPRGGEGCVVGSSYDPGCDVNHDGITDIVDLQLVANHWRHTGIWTSDSWRLTGNAGTDPSSNFLGTTDSQPLIMTTNGAAAMSIDTAGNVGIGTTSPIGNLHVKDDLVDLMAVGNFTISNLEPTPATVRHTSRFFPRALNGASESAGIYMRVDPIGSNNQLVGVYGEITEQQEDTEGAFMKVIHQGHGDAIFTALRGSGAAAFEAASFADGTKGIISTMQESGLANSTLFNALWGQDTIPNFGMYYADQAPGRALTIRKTSSAIDGVEQIRLLENDLSRNRFAVFNSGATHLVGLAATSGSQEIDSPELVLRGAYWNGATSVDRNAIIKEVVTGAGTSELRVYLGDTGAELPELLLSSESMDLQSNDLVNVGNAALVGTLNVSGAGDSTFSGKVDIGTAGPIASDAKLHVSGGNIDLQGGGYRFIRPDGSHPADLAIFRGGPSDNGVFTFRRFPRTEEPNPDPDPAHTILKINSPPGSVNDPSNPLEATLALVRGDDPNVELVDFYNNGYPDETQYGIRMIKRGTGQYRDFVFDYFDGTTKNEVMRLTPSGNVGIGTTTPQERLHVAGNVRLDSLLDLGADECADPSAAGRGRLCFDGTNFRVSENGGAYQALLSEDSGWSLTGNTGTDPSSNFLGTTDPQPLVIATNGAEAMRIDTAGNVGIGTPSAGGSNLRIKDSGSVDVILENTEAIAAAGMQLNPDRFLVGTYGDVPVDFLSRAVSRVRIAGNGNVGIGTTNPTDKLEVKDGNIRVTNGSFIDDGTTLNAPDYVFEEDYPLMTLDDLKAYVAQQKHLPNVPSAEDIRRDGLDLSQFQMTLLEKVEELTLYTLAQQAKLEAKNQQIEAQQQQITALETRLAVLERTVGANGAPERLFSTSLPAGWLLFGGLVLAGLVVEQRRRTGSQR